MRIVGTKQKVRLDTVYAQMWPCEIIEAGQSYMIMQPYISDAEISHKEVVYETKP
jgi:hypothetical protein